MGIEASDFTRFFTTLLCFALLCQNHASSKRALSTRHFVDRRHSVYMWAVEFQPLLRRSLHRGLQCTLHSADNQASPTPEESIRAVGFVVAAASAIFRLVCAGFYSMDGGAEEETGPASLLLVIGEPWSNQHRHLIIERLKTGRCCRRRRCQHVHLFRLQHHVDIYPVLPLLSHH